MRCSLNSGYLDGEVVEHGREERFEFTWEGQDENDPALGSGWLKLSDENNLEGRIGGTTTSDKTYSKDVGFLGQGLIPQESRPLQLGQSHRARS